MRASCDLRRGLAALTAILVWAMAAVAQSTSGEAQTWWRNARTIQSRYYNVRTDLPPDSARMVAEHMDRMCDAYQRILAGFRVRGQFRLEICLFRTQQSYLTVLEHRFDADGSGSAGVCIPRGTRITLAAWLRGDDPSSLLATLRHEGFHQFARAMFRLIPPWADEGLAELFESAVVAGEKVIVGEVPSGRLNYLLEASRQQKLKRFDAFMSMDREDWNEHVRVGSAALNYAQAWALVHFFLYAENARYQRGFGEFLAQMNRGSSWENAFLMAFDTRDYEALQAQFLSHLNRLRPTDFHATLQRLAFLAEGARALAERDIFPTTIDEMRRELQTIGFEHVIRDGGRRITIAASDAESFRIPLAKTSPEGARFQLLPWPDSDEKEKDHSTGRRGQAAKPAPLPLRIVTSGLLPRTFGVNWKRDRRGRLSYVLVTD